MHALIAQAAEAAQRSESLMTGVSTVFSIMAGICSATVVWYLRGIATRVEKVEADVKILTNRKIDCQRDFVSAETFVRSEGYSRQKLDLVAERVSAIDTKVDIVKILPEAMGTFAREFTKGLREDKHA